MHDDRKCSAHAVACNSSSRRYPTSLWQGACPCLGKETQTPTWWRDGVGLAGGRPCGPRLPQRIAEHGGEVVAEGGLVPPRRQPLALQGLERRAGRQDGRPRQRAYRVLRPTGWDMVRFCNWTVR